MTQKLSDTAGDGPGSKNGSLGRSSAVYFSTLGNSMFKIAGVNSLYFIAFLTNYNAVALNQIRLAQ